MQEISGSLSEVIRAYSDHNLLVPAATDVQLNPFYKYHVEEVAVDLSENRDRKSTRLNSSHT